MPAQGCGSLTGVQTDGSPVPLAGAVLHPEAYGDAQATHPATQAEVTTKPRQRWRGVRIEHTLSAARSCVGRSISAHPNARSAHASLADDAIQAAVKLASANGVCRIASRSGVMSRQVKAQSGGARHRSVSPSLIPISIEG